MTRSGRRFFEECDEDTIISNKKITYTLKPHPVKPTLSKIHFDLLKHAEQEMTCAICMEHIDCKCCFTLYTCGHYYHSACVEQLQKPMCATCGI